MNKILAIAFFALLYSYCAADGRYKGSKKYNQALNLYEVKNFEEALKITSLIKSSLFDSLELAHTYFLEGYIHLKQDSIKLAYLDFKEAKRLFIALDKKQYIAKSYNRLGRISYELCSFTKALSYYEFASKYSRSISDTKQLINDLHAIGQSLKRLGQYEGAIKNLYEARKLAQEGEYLYKFLNIQLEIGNIQHLAGNHDLAIEDYWQLMNTATGTQYEAVMKAKCYNNLGSAYLEKGNYDLAVQYLKKSLSYASLSDEQVAVIYNNLGQISNKQGELRKALAYFQKSVTLNQNNVDLEEVTFTFNQIRSIPSISTNRDSLSYYMNIYKSIRLPIISKRKVLESIDLKYESQGYEKAKLKHKELVKWKYWMTLALLLAILLSLLITLILLKRQRRGFDKRKQWIKDSLMATINKFEIPE